jgi:hypothetical protein
MWLSKRFYGMKKIVGLGYQAKQQQAITDTVLGPGQLL